MIKPLGPEPIMGICEFAYRAKKHWNKSDTHSIQQMAVVYIHKQILGLASGLSLHFLTIAPPSVAKKVWANFKNLPWLLRRNNWGPTGGGWKNPRLGVTHFPLCCGPGRGEKAGAVICSNPLAASFPEISKRSVCLCVQANQHKKVLSACSMWDASPCCGSKASGLPISNQEY